MTSRSEPAMKSDSLIDLAILRLGASPEVADGFAADALRTARAIRRAPLKTLRAIAKSLLEPMPKDWKPGPSDSGIGAP